MRKRRTRELRRALIFRLFYPRIYRFLQLTVGTFLRYRYVVSASNRGVFAGLEAPYLVLPNHGSFWDPVFVSTYVPDPVYWIASDAQFRGAARYFLRLIGAVPKSKGVSDIETIRSIMDIRKRNGVIGIFPEGVRTWDGHSLPVIPATAKLIKLLKIPVIVPKISGAYLSFPRWARSFRKGQVSIAFQYAFTPAEIRESSVESIAERLNALLAHDAYQDELERPVPFVGHRLAESVERALFVCPDCRGIATLRSKDGILSCTACGYRVSYNEYGFFDKRSRHFYFASVHEWNDWQLGFLARTFRTEYVPGLEKPFFEDRAVCLWIGYRSRPLRKLRIGRMQLLSDRIVFTTLRRERIIFDIGSIVGINVQNKERLEFYLSGVLYQFRFTRRSASAYKWQESVCILKEM